MTKPITLPEFTDEDAREMHIEHLKFLFSVAVKALKAIRDTGEGHEDKNPSMQYGFCVGVATRALEEMGIK